MKIFNKVSIVLLAVAFAFGLIGPMTAHAVTTAPALGAADGYSVYSDAGLTNSGGTHVWGKVGDNGVSHVGLTVGMVDSGIIDAGTGIATDALVTAYNFLDLGAQTPVAALNLNGDHTVTPGVWLVGATALTGTLTLNGAGVYIFRSDSSISVSGAGTMVLTNGATACNVFWQIPTSMTISNAAHIEGTIIAKTGNITFVDSASLVGRALAHTQITMINNQITEPVCAAAPLAYTPPTNINQPGTINVVKIVINDNGRTKTIADFPLFINGAPAVSGVTYSFPAPADVFTVTETLDPNYTRTFSGDCDVNGQLNLNPGYQKFCIVTNNDIGTPVVVPPVPPLIDMVKTASPLSLPAGPGSVVYTYTLRNTGTVPVTNITIVGDTCSPIILASGDTNGDNKLDVNETWVNTCTKTLSATHTNTAVVTGWANGISVVDIASATVIVGASVVPPLIHVTKIPSPLTLPAGGGMVTYTKKVTNPGTVALSNIRLTDDKCNSVKYISGDTNNNSKLDTNETWTYTCQVNLTKTTTNTVTASGDANGLTARDFAIAHVVVATAAPALPNTGFAPEGKSTLWNIVLLAGIFAVSIFYLARRKQTT